MRLLKQFYIFIFFFSIFLGAPFLSLNNISAAYTPAINANCATIQNTSYINCTDSTLASDDGSTVAITSGSNGGGIISFHGWNFGVSPTATVSAFKIKVHAQVTCNQPSCGPLRPLFSLDGTFTDIYRDGSQEFMPNSGYQTYEFSVPIPFVNLNSPFNVYNITPQMANNGAIYTEMVFDTPNATVNVDSISVDLVYTAGPGKTPVILIPGIMGSKFSVIGSDPIEPIQKQKLDPISGNCVADSDNWTYAQGDLVWIDESLINRLSTGSKISLPCANYLDVLQFNQNGQPLYPQVGLSGEIVDESYKDTITYLQNNGYTLGENLFIFPYDWRKAIASNIPLLNDKITTVVSETGSLKVNIIAHSMGGILAQEYIREQSQADKVNKLITVGTPHVGSPKMLTQLLYTTCPFKILLFICVPNGHEANKLVQNFPEVFELLPSKQYYQLYSDLKPFMDGRDVDDNGVTGALNYSQLKTLLTNLDKNMSLFDMAESFHDTLDPTYDDDNGVTKYLIAGSGKDTFGQILEYTWNGQVHKLDALLTNGDGTVPVKSATLGQTSNVFYIEQDHMKLLANGPGLQMAVKLLEGDTNLINGVQTTPFTFTGKVASVHSPVEIHAYDSLGNHTGASSSGGFEANIPGSSYDELGDAKFIYLPEGGTYEIKTKATDAGKFDLKIKSYENSELTEHELFIDVNQTANTTASMDLDETPVLEVDTDNDGTVDQNVPPTYTLTGQDVNAIAPPSTTASLSPTPNGQGEYEGPVTVTLAADASAGFTVENIYYKIDNGSQQTYSTPFTVNGLGEHTITYWSVDNAGLVETADTKSFTIVGHPPTVNAFSGGTIDEGDTYTATGSFSDPGSTSWSATVDYGDGAGAEILILNPDNTFSLNHLYKDNGTYTVTVQVHDEGGLVGTKTATVTVNNVKPAVGGITVPTSPTSKTTAVNVSSSFTDAGTLDTHTAVWNWGDNTTSNGTATETNGSGSVTGNHTYTQGGLYTITLTVTDDDNGEETKTAAQYIIVYDTTKSVSSISKYTSQPGAYVPNSQVGGTAELGVSGRYSNNNPSGYLTFKFPAAPFEFVTFSPQWVVVKGNRAYMKGNGLTTTGQGTMFVSAIDGGASSQDRVRVKIFNAQGTVIYDTQMGASDTADPLTPLTFGGVTIQ